MIEPANQGSFRTKKQTLVAFDQGLFYNERTMVCFWGVKAQYRPDDSPWAAALLQ